MMLAFTGSSGSLPKWFDMDIISSKVSLPFILLLNKNIEASIVVIKIVDILHQFGSLLKEITMK